MASKFQTTFIHRSPPQPPLTPPPKTMSVSDDNEADVKGAGGRSDSGDGVSDDNEADVKGANGRPALDNFVSNDEDAVVRASASPDSDDSVYEDADVIARGSTDSDRLDYEDADVKACDSPVSENVGEDSNKVGDIEVIPSELLQLLAKIIRANGADQKQPKGESVVAQDHNEADDIAMIPIEVIKILAEIMRLFAADEGCKNQPSCERESKIGEDDSKAKAVDENTKDVLKWSVERITKSDDASGVSYSEVWKWETPSTPTSPPPPPPFTPTTPPPSPTTPPSSFPLPPTPPLATSPPFPTTPGTITIMVGGHYYYYPPRASKLNLKEEALKFIYQEVLKSSRNVTAYAIIQKFGGLQRIHDIFAGKAI